MHRKLLIKIETLLVKKWYKVVECGKMNLYLHQNSSDPC
jgi:hypothetical protein